jgi:hypothetical protein
MNALKKSVRQYVDLRKDDHKPFVWTTTADEFVASDERFSL